MGVALLVSAWILLTDPSSSALPEYVVSDSLIHAEAVGLCAVSRETGVLQGVIVGVDSVHASRPPQYRIQRLNNPSAEYLHVPTAVYVVRCEQYR